MNRLLLACALSFAAVPAAFPQESPATPPAAEAPAAPPVPVANAPAAEPTPEDMERRIETSVLRLVEKVINAAGDEIPDAEKEAILSDVRAELKNEHAKLIIVDSDDAASQDELETKVQAGVLRLVDKVISAAGEVSEEEKKEILAEVKAEMEAEDDSDGGAGFNINIDGDGASGMGLHEMFIAILAISLIFGTPIFVVIAVLYAGYRKRRLVQETITQYLSSGKDVPPEILESIHGGAEKPKNYLQKGFVMVGTGLGIFLCFAIMGEIGIASLGVIPLFIGLAQILIWKLEKPDHGPRG